MRLRILAVAALLLLAACATKSGPARPGYTPVPDSVLYHRIAAIHGVTSVHVVYAADWVAGQRYAGTVDVSDSKDALRILDEAFAILRMGHYDAGLYVDVVEPSGRHLGRRSLGLHSDQDVAARYGPQPGSGVPPSTLPTAHPS